MANESKDSYSFKKVFDKSRPSNGQVNIQQIEPQQFYQPMTERAGGHNNTNQMTNVNGPIDIIMGATSLHERQDG